MKEEALLFGKMRSLVGIVTYPLESVATVNLPAVVILNAGIMHRVGPNRLHVKMARTLAAMGFVVLRCDFSGIGDSKVRGDALPFEKSAVDETREAMECIHEATGTEKFVLMGMCSGATISFKTACRDPRVVGAVLINARMHLHPMNDELHDYIRNRALARHYWRIALFSSFRAKNWLKAITGKVDSWEIISKMVMGFQIGSLFGHQRKVSSEVNHVSANLRSLSERGVRLLHIYSEGDEGLDYLHVILGGKLKEWRSDGRFHIETIQGANHTFTLLWSQEHLMKVVQSWMFKIVQDSTASGTNQTLSREVIQLTEA
jgi:pimeloyl-ACP methyl ester carboxylesterase